MEGIHVPAAVSVPHRLQPVEGGLHSRVVSVSEGREDIEPHEDVVVVVDRIVEPEPRRVRSGSLAGQTALQIELRASLNRPEDFRAAGGR